MKMHRVAILSGCVFSIAWLASAAGGKPYYEQLASDAGRFSSGGVLVESVEPAGAGARAGLQARDVIVGVDSNRVHGVMDFRYLWKRSVTNGWLNVRRGDHLLTLHVTGMVSNKLQAMFNLSVLPVAQMLRDDFKLSPAHYMGSVIGPRADDGLLDRLAAACDARRPPLHPLFARLQYFPERAADVLHQLGVRPAKDPALAPWVQALFQTYMALSEERYADAQRIADASKLAEAHFDPFLSDLAAFYLAIARHPPDATNGPPADGYDVSPDFATMCYPLPVRVERRYNWKAVHPEFGAALERTQSIPKEEDPNREWSVYPVKEAMTPMCFNLSGKYMRGVAMAMLDDQNQGGWPIRDMDIRSPENRQMFIAQFREMIASNYPYKVLAAMSLIMPAVLEDDWESFALAYTTLADAGAWEMATGSKILDLGLWDWKLERPKFLSVQRSVEKKVGIPALYLWLERNSPRLQGWMKQGYYLRRGDSITEPGTYLPNSPEILAQAWPTTAP